LLATLAVIVWGVFVRASGSGAGCGNHWPLCNGVIVPTSPTTATLIELTHRVTSAFAGFLVLLLVFFARRAFEPGHLVRKLTWAALFLMITEGLIGGGLVLFEMVATNESLARGYWMSAHLINTFFLVAAQTLVVWASDRDARPSLAGRERAAWLTGTALFALLVTGISGAIAALGDTLFPAKSFAEGLAADTAAGAHLFVELRVLHPFVAVGTAIHVLIVASTFARSADHATRVAAQRTGLLILAQVAVGFVNLLLAAPVSLQLVHLLLADFVWMSVVVLTAQSLTSDRQTEALAHQALAHAHPSAAIGDDGGAVDQTGGV